jgi:E3 ubiquitin-protein ligase listerin
MLFFIRESASASEVESIIGTWCMAAQDIDRQVSEAASKSWNAVVTAAAAQSKHQLGLEGELLGSLISFIQNAALDPLGVYTYLNPVTPVAPPPPVHRKSGTRPTPAPARKEADQSARAKNDEVEENDQDKKARIRHGAIGAIRWVLGNAPHDSIKQLN